MFWCIRIRSSREPDGVPPGVRVLYRQLVGSSMVPLLVVMIERQDPKLKVNPTRLSSNTSCHALWNTLWTSSLRPL
jgi:hypothetical protein